MNKKKLNKILAMLGLAVILSNVFFAVSTDNLPYIILSFSISWIFAPILISKI